MEKRVALLGIIVENPKSVDSLNEVLHEHRDSIVGRMGIPYRQRKVDNISVVVDAPKEDTEALAGKLAGIDGVNVSISYAKA